MLYWMGAGVWSFMEFVFPSLPSEDCEPEGDDGTALYPPAGCWLLPTPA